MSGRRVKETMDQIHIPKEMQEEIIRNLQNRTGNQKVCISWKKTATVAAALVLAAGLVSIPVQALVQNFITARMESIPEEEVMDMEHMIQEQHIEADSFSRKYSDSEKERMKELRQLYENGTFPEKTIPQVKDRSEAAEGILCYVWETGLFCLPERELTDEELLEIIDFDRTRSYAIEQGSAGQAAREEYRAEQDGRRERIQAAGGISEEEAVEIATRQMKSELGPAAEGKKFLTVYLEDISEADYEHKGDVAYVVGFGNPENYSTYTCEIDSGDGKVLNTVKYEP